MKISKKDRAAYVETLKQLISVMDADDVFEIAAGNREFSLFPEASTIRLTNRGSEESSTFNDPQHGLGVSIPFTIIRDFEDAFFFEQNSSSDLDPEDEWANVKTASVERVPELKSGFLKEAGYAIGRACDEAEDELDQISQNNNR